MSSKYYKQINILSGQRNFKLTFHNEPDTRALITKIEMFVWTLDVTKNWSPKLIFLSEKKLERIL